MSNPLAWFKGAVLRATCPLFFNKIGRGTSFYGRVRLPLARRNIRLGTHCSIGDSVFFQTGSSAKILIGNNCTLNSGCHIVANELIAIGNNVSIGEYVSIRDQDHLFSVNAGVIDQGYRVAPISIGDNVWIGRGTFIAAGTRIESGTIVGANSVVRGSFPRNVLIAGAPAIIKKKLA